MRKPGTPKKNREGSSSAELQSGGVCPICQGFGYLRRDVPPGHPDFGRLIPCKCKVRENTEHQLEDLRRTSNLGLLARMTFETFVLEGHGLPPLLANNLHQAYKGALQYAEDPQGWLILQGSYGCGKTHLAAAIANRLMERGHPVIFAVVPDLLDHLRTTYAPNSPVTFDQRFETVRTAPMLILDDLGAHSSTSWAQEKLYQILNYRYNAQLPTVITTNCALEDLDPRLRSRMAEINWASVVYIKASDYRGAIIKNGSEPNTLTLHQDQTFENFDLREHDPDVDLAQRTNLKRTLNIAENYAETPSGWLVLTGGYGCGKTHLAAAIANYCMCKGMSTMFVVVPDLLDHLRAAFAPGSTVTFDRRFDLVRSAELLVLDDLGTHSATPWAQEKLFQLLDYRYNARSLTVITMAKDIDLDPRLKTRIWDASRCQVREIIAPSYYATGAPLSGREKNPSHGGPGSHRKGLGAPAR